MSDVTSAAPAAAASVEVAEGAPGQAQQTTPEQPKRLSQKERKEALVARLRAGKEAKQAERQQPQESAPQGAEPAADAQVEAEAEPDQATEKKAPEKKETERDRDIELKAARLARELKDARADAIDWKPKAEKFDALSAKLEKARGDIYTAVNMLPELFGMDFGQIAEHVVKNADKYQESKKYADLPPDIREEVELARKERAERAEREKKAAEEARVNQLYTSYEGKVKTFLADNSDEYPLAAALDWAAGDVATQCIRRNTRDATSVLRELEDTLRKNLSGAISNDRVLKSLIADKELRAKIASAIGAAAESNNRPASGASLQNGAPKSERNSGEGPATLTNRSTSSDTASASSRPSREERKRKIAEAFRAANFTRR